MLSRVLLNLDTMTIDVEDMRTVFRGMREKYFEFDVVGNGEITCEEFRQVWRVSLFECILVYL